MPESIHEQIGENTVRQMDMLAITLGISEENMPAFVAKRNVVAWVFAESNVPDDIHEMLANIRQGADSAPFAAYIQKPEFVLDAVMAGYALRARRTEP